MQLNLLVKPVAEVTVCNSTIYLFPPATNDVSEFAYLPEAADAAEKFRSFLPFIASQSVPASFREKRIPLDDGMIARLDAAELEKIASAYCGIPSFDKVRAGNAAENVAPIVRESGESAIAFLNRLLSAEAERQRRIFEKLYADEAAQ